MQPSALDPISLRYVDDLDNAPFVVERSGPHALKLYFESEANRQAYLSMPISDCGFLSNENFPELPEAKRTGTYN